MIETARHLIAGVAHANQKCGIAKLGDAAAEIAFGKGLRLIVLAEEEAVLEGEKKATVGVY
jgi:hypothetical protein